jgi:UDP-glucuronate decarboxylase
MKKVLVTGGAGFIGYYLCSALLKDGCLVYCLDNFLTSSLKKLSPLLENKNFLLLKQDIIEKIKDKIQVDAIYNLACPASPKYYQHNPVYTLKTNVLGIINMLNLAVKCRAKIFQASTSEIYGDPLEHPQNENYKGNVNPIGLRSCYDEGKRCAEAFSFAYHRVYQVKIKIARIFNIYGPYMTPNDGRVISNFIVAALKNDPITIHGDGSQTRSFCFIFDAITGILALMQSEDSVIGPINLGNPYEISVYNLAKKIIEFTNSRSKIVFLPLPQDDPRRRKPDISKALNILGWTPRFSLEDGLKATIQYFEKII